MRVIAYVVAVIAMMIGFAFLVTGIMSLPSTPDPKVEGSIARSDCIITTSRAGTNLREA